MMRTDHRAYELVALEAGRRAGLAAMPPRDTVAGLDAEAMKGLLARVADERGAVQIRDELTADLDRRLRDSGYTGDQVHEWFVGQYGPIGRASIYRARATVRAADSRIAETAEQARAFVELAEAEGADGVFAGATKRAGQLMFQLLYQAEAKDIKVDDLYRIVIGLAKLQKARAETEVLREKVSEIRKAALAGVERAAARAGRRGLSRDDVYRILDDAMKGAA